MSRRARPRPELAAAAARRRRALKLLEQADRRLCDAFVALFNARRLLEHPRRRR